MVSGTGFPNSSFQMVAPWLPPAHEHPAALAGAGGEHMGVLPWCPPTAGTDRQHSSPSWHRPQAVSAAALPLFIASWHQGCIFDKLGCNSQQLLSHPQEMGRTWGRDAAGRPQARPRQGEALSHPGI